MVVPVVFDIISMMFVLLGIFLFFYNKASSGIRGTFVILGFIALGLVIEGPFCAYEVSMQSPGGSFRVCGTSFMLLLAWAVIGSPLMVILFLHKLKKEKVKKH